MGKVYKILTINPGSISTKIALFENEHELLKTSIEHSNEELAKYIKTAEQYEMRKEAVIGLLKEANVDTSELAAVVGRGGSLPKVKTGVYVVNQEMVNRLLTRPLGEHASSLGAPIAYGIAKPLGIPAFINDSVRADELQDVARVLGLPCIERGSRMHVLNMRAVAKKYAKRIGKKFDELNLIIAHLGGGITLSVIEKGRIIDYVADDEGPFSPDRVGRIPCTDLIDFIYSHNYSRDQMIKLIRGQSGLAGHLGTNKATEVEKRIKEGDKKAELVYYVMAYQVAKAIGELATVVKGEVDCIIITGGIAYSKMMTGWIAERVGFLGPVEIIPGENELESLACGALRVLNGEEEAQEYAELE